MLNSASSSRWLLVLAALPLLGHAGDDIPVDALPTPVAEAIQARFPEGELLVAEREDNEGHIAYEVELRSNGRRYEVDVSASGQIFDIDDEGEDRGATS